MQTADSSFSAIVTSLNTAVTLGTSGAGSTVSTANKQAIATELEGVLSSVVAQGNASYQGVYLFAGSASSTLPLVPASTTYTSLAGTVALPLTGAYPLTAGSVTSISDASTGKTFVFTASAGATLSQLSTAVANAAAAGTLSAGTTATINSTGQLSIGSNSSSDGIVVTTNDPALGAMNATPGTEVANSYAYVGNSTVNSVPVGDSLSVATNVPGAQLFTSGANVIGALNGLITALQSWDERANPNRDRRRFHIIEQCYPATRSLGQQHQPVEFSGELPEPGNTDADHASRLRWSESTWRRQLPISPRRRPRTAPCWQLPRKSCPKPCSPISHRDNLEVRGHRCVQPRFNQRVAAAVCPCGRRIRPDLLHLLSLALS